MFWKKDFTSKEYLSLKEEIEDLKIQLKSLVLELELYTKKLKASKGLKDLKEEKDDTENYKNSILLPE